MLDGGLSVQGEVQSMSKQFALMGDDCERMKFVLEKNFTSSLHWKDFNFSSKVSWDQCCGSGVSVADPGWVNQSGVNIPDRISESLEKIFKLKILPCFMTPRIA